MGVQVIPIPTEVVSQAPFYSHSQFCVLFPFPWDSHGIPSPIGNPIPMHISSTDAAVRHWSRGHPYSMWCLCLIMSMCVSDSVSDVDNVRLINFCNYFP